jgi:hypothetical protein
MVDVIKSKFQGANKEGDFAWMIKQPHHQGTLFLFNDNEGEFYQHFNGGQHRCGAGGGNAGIRPYQCQSSPQAIGIPTGTYDSGPHYMGYTSLDDHVKKVLDDAFKQIESLLKTGRYTAIAFSWDDKTKLGGKIFETAQPVRDYIVERIFLTAEKF